MPEIINLHGSGVTCECGECGLENFYFIRAEDKLVIICQNCKFAIGEMYPYEDDV